MTIGKVECVKIERIKDALDYYAVSFCNDAKTVGLALHWYDGAGTLPFQVGKSYELKVGE